MITDSIISGNKATGNGGSGGGLWVGNLSAVNSVISGNTTLGDLAYGGGTYARGSVDLTNLP